MPAKIFIYSVNPVQYHAPIFKALSKKLNILVGFGDSIGVIPFYNKELRTVIKWDIPLIEGYSYKFFKNYAKKNSRGFFSRINIGMFFHVIVNNYDAVLIHGYDTISSWIVFFAAKLSLKKIIWRGEAAIRPKVRQKKINNIIKKFVLPQYFRCCDAVMYSCTGNKEYLKQFLIPDKKMFLIPCAVDNDFFRYERGKYLNKNDVIKSELGIPSDNFVILFSSRFTTRKRPLDLIEAVAKMNCQNITLLFVGDGIERENMERLIAKYCLHAVFTGFQGQLKLPMYYSIADIFVLVSDYDASPKSLNEALNFELPIIVTDFVGTAKDLVKNGENGFIVKTRDINEISNRIKFVLNNKKIAAEMGKKSLEISDEWSIDNDVVGVENAVNYVLKR